jgi:hypothetical protein
MREDAAMSDTDTVPALLWSEEYTAEVLGLTRQSLRADRHRCVGLPYVKFGNRIRYRADDVLAFIAAHSVVPGSPQPTQTDRGQHSGS